QKRQEVLFLEKQTKLKFGHDTIVDGMVKDGLWDAFNDFKMGNCGEICADMHELTREQQVEVPGPRGRPSTIVDKDEDLGKFDLAKLRKLRPDLKENGGSVNKEHELGLMVIAKVSGYADAEQAPELFTTSSALAIPKAISRAGLEASQIDFYEINEAFSRCCTFKPKAA
ncbi:acetyl-CoA acetyltransferase, cytosolic 1-like protein, partial [Tanacetum coccineum]